MWYLRGKKLLRAGQKVRRENEWLEKFYDYALACNSQKRQISPMEVVEDFESRPHKAVSFVVESENDMQEWNEQKLLGYSGRGLPGGCTN